MMRVWCMGLVGLFAAKKSEPPPEAPPIDGVRVEAIRLTVHARALEVVEDVAVPAEAIERDVFVSLPLVELPTAIEVSLVDAAGHEVCEGLAWRRLPQKIRTTALLHGSAHESGIAFPLRACASLAANRGFTVRVREAYARSESPVIDWRRALGSEGIEPVPLRHITVTRSDGVATIAHAEAKFSRSVRDDDARPVLFVEGELQSADPAAADPALVERTSGDRLRVRVWLTP